MTVRMTALGLIFVLTAGAMFSSAAAQETPKVAAAGELADAAAAPPREATESPFAVVIDPERITSFDYRVSINGQLMTPAEAGVQKWKLTSSGAFRFVQRQRSTELSGPLSLDAVRRFGAAEVSMTVGDDHRTVTQLPASLRTIRSTGADSGLVHTAATKRTIPLTRKHVDLLQMPGDPLVCGGLMPTGDVTVNDKWNCDSWVLPLLTGLEAVIEQNVTCELKSLDGNAATVAFRGTASGAVVGSASKVDVTGELTFDRKAGLITSFRATQQEERSTGPISPGLKVTVEVTWTQRVAEPSADITADSADLPTEFADEEPTAEQLSLQIQTPWKLQFQHSREWHVFNQSPTLLLLRQIRNGNLIAQCNLSQGVTVAPGQGSDDAQFAADVQRAVDGRDGRIVDQATIRDDAAWRIRHVRGTGKANEQTIFYDYYLCAAKSGERFSFVFSHSESDAEEFGDEAKQILDTLTLLRRRPALPFR